MYTDTMHALLRKTFGIDSFRNSQEAVITDILAGRHCLVLMPTGMGKSLCYQLPALMMDGLAVVISPLIALMKDQVDSLVKLGIDAAYINSSLGKHERENRYQNISEGRYKIIFVSPERFKKEEFINVICTRNISLLAVDEAHCASQWGNDFRPDYAKLAGFRKILGTPVTIALTATATRIVQDDIVSKLGIPKDEITIYNEGISRPNLNLSVIHVLDDGEKYQEILEILETEKGNSIVYFSLIKSLEAFSSFLQVEKISHSVYHGKLPAQKRKAIQKKFMDGSNSLMLATNAFGMGVDKADIRIIIHAEIPDSLESYYQEIGRAGRDGKPSKAVLIYNEADLGTQMNFLEWRNPEVPFILKTYRLLKEHGHSLSSYTYEELQEQLVHKNRGDHRLQTVLNLFDRYHVTSGSIDYHTLRIIAPLPDHLVSEEFNQKKMKADQNRLYKMLQYAKSSECRRALIHDYFDILLDGCGNCDNCEIKTNTNIL